MCLSPEQRQYAKKSFIIALSHLLSNYLVKPLLCNNILKNIQLLPPEARKVINSLITFPREARAFKGRFLGLLLICPYMLITPEPVPADVLSTSPRLFLGLQLL